MNRIDQGTLSQRGAQRRDAMLDDLRDEMARHHSRRRTLRGGLGSLAAVVMLVAGLIVFRGPDQPTDLRGADTTASRDPIERSSLSDRESSTRVRIVPTSSDVLDRYTRHSAGASGRVSIRRISDAELLGLLAEMNRPTGLIRFSDEVRLTDAVVDPPSEQHQPEEDAQFDSRRDTAGAIRS